MKYSSRFFLYAPMGVFLLLFAAAAVHWWILASQLSARLNALNGQAIAPGVTLSFKTHRTTGFPFSLDTELRDVTLAVATPDGVTKWHAAEFAMHALTYGREETVFEAAGPQSLAWGGDPRTLSFAVGSLRASALMRHGALARFDLDLVGFGSKAFTAQRLQFHMRRARSGRLDVDVSASDLRPSAGDCPRLGPHLAHGVMEGRVRGAEAFAAVLSGTEGWTSAVAAWRKRGGAFVSERPAAAPFDTGLQSLPADRLFSVTALTDAVCGRAS